MKQADCLQFHFCIGHMSRSSHCSSLSFEGPIQIPYFMGLISFDVPLSAFYFNGYDKWRHSSVSREYMVLSICSVVSDFFVSSYASHETRLDLEVQTWNPLRKCHIEPSFDCLQFLVVLAQDHPNCSIIWSDCGGVPDSKSHGNRSSLAGVSLVLSWTEER